MEGCYIIAEMACSHDGDVDKAKIIVDAAIAAKADAYTTPNLATPKFSSARS